MDFTIQSPSFTENELISPRFTCDGADISPALEWINPPQNTQSFVLIVDDPDAPHGTWVHWILYNLPPNINELEEGIKELPYPTQSGVNSWQEKKYQGPCPPGKNAHHYHFKLFALSKTLELHHQLNKQNIEAAMQNCILKQVQLVAIYSRDPIHGHKQKQELDLTDATTILRKKHINQNIKERATKEIEKEMEKK